MSTNLSNAAYEVLKTDMVELIGKIRKAVMEVALDVANEDQANKADAFTVDIAASAVMKELAEFIIQGSIDAEDWCPLLHPSQLKRKYARTWWSIKK